MTIREFVGLLQLKYKTAYETNEQKINNLESELLKCQQELFLLRNKQTLDKFHQNFTLKSTQDTILKSFITTTQSSQNAKTTDSPTTIRPFDEYSQAKQKYQNHKEFIVNLIKLKVIGKNFSLNENTQIILTTLQEFLEQIKSFFFGDQLDPTGLDYEQQAACDFSFDCLVHSLQILLNVFQVEWLYYLRSSLIDSLVQFVDDLVKFVLEFTESAKSNRLKLKCACEMLVCLSTCDYLIEHVLNAIVHGLQSLVKYLCESSSTNDIYSQNDGGNRSKDFKSSPAGDKNSILIENCADLLEHVDRMLQIRLLQYNTHLSASLNENLKQFFDFIFIHLTDVYPLLAVKLTKILQILNK